MIEQVPKRKDSFMIVETYDKSVEDIRELYGDEEAERLVLEIFYIGIREERTSTKLQTMTESVLATIAAKINKSKERGRRTLDKRSGRHSFENAREGGKEEIKEEKDLN